MSGQMTREEAFDTAVYFLELVRYGIDLKRREKGIREKPANVRFEVLFSLSERHMLSAATYMGIRALKESLPKNWKRSGKPLIIPPFASTPSRNVSGRNSKRLLPSGI